MKLLLFATLVEASATLSMLKAKSMEPNLYSIDGGKIAITGMGILAALSATLSFGVDADEIYNFGFAGAVNRKLTIHSVHRVKAVSKNLSFPDQLDFGSQKIAFESHPELEVHDNGLRLISSDYPIFTSALPQAFTNFDLVDMEGYGVAFAAKTLKKRATLIKVVSDFANTGDRKILHQEKDHLSEILSETCEKLLLSS